MSASTAKTIFQHEVVVSDATTGEQAGLVIGTGTQLGTSSVPAAGLIGYDVATNAHVAGVYSGTSGALGDKVARAVAVPIASGIITVVNGGTTASVRLPAAWVPSTQRMTSSFAGSVAATTATSAPVFSYSLPNPGEHTLTVTLAAVATGIAYISYEIYAAPTP